MNISGLNRSDFIPERSGTKFKEPVFRPQYTSNFPPDKVFVTFFAPFITLASSHGTVFINLPSKPPESPMNVGKPDSKKRKDDEKRSQHF